MAPDPFTLGESEVGGPDVLGPEATVTAALPRSPGYGWLVELDTGLWVREWVSASAISMDQVDVFMDDTSATPAGGAGVYAASVGRDVRCVDAVYDNGVALTAVASVDLVDSTVGSWYFAAVAGALLVHTTGSAAIAGRTVIATVVELSKFGPGPSVFTRAGVPYVYYARLESVPGVTLDFAADDIGASSVATFGQLGIANHDGYLSGDSHPGRRGLLAERLFAGRAARVYRGDMANLALEDFTLWATATMERPSCTPEAGTIPLVSMARLLGAAMCPTSFDLATYPAMDATLVGVPIPRTYGTVTGVEAFRIGNGLWKVSAYAMTSITACKQANGTVVTITGTDLPNGTLTVTTALNTERRLYVDGVGRVASGLPGALLSQLAQDGGVSVSDIDTTALDRVDADRAVALGMQVRSGSVRDALGRVAESAFVDWLITRENVVSGRARARDAGNLVLNPGFEVDTTGWTGQQSAAIARTTTYHARGVAALQITKDAANALGYARVLPRRPCVAGSRYALTCLVALAPASPATDACRLSLVDGAGTEDLSDPFSLVAGVWQRVFFVSQGVGQVAVTMDLTSITMDSTLITMDMGAVELRIYPQYGGASAVVLLVDEVEWVEVLALTESMADVDAATTEALQLSRVRARYAFDERANDGPYAIAEDTTLTRLYPGAESRTLDSDLVASGDGALVAAAALDYFSASRARLGVTIKAPIETPITHDTVFHVSHRRAPGLVNHSGLWRVVSASQGQATRNALPTIDVELVAHYDPAMDRMPV